MRRFLFLAVLGACAPSQPAFTAADEAAVRAVPGQFTSAMMAGNWDAWSNLLTEDVAFLPPNAAALEGREAVLAWGRAFPRLASFTAEATEVTGSGDWAFARGTYSFTTAPDSGPPLSEQGKWMAVHRRQPDGSWPISRDIWNSNLPLPGAAPAN